MSPTQKADEATEEEKDETQEEGSPEQSEEDPVAEKDVTTNRGGFGLITTKESLVEFLEPYDSIVDEMKLHLDEGEITAAAVDPANVGMVDASVDPSAFEHYSTTGVLIGFNLERMLDILSIGDSGDLVEFDIDQETRKLDITIGGLEYTMALIDPDSIRQEPDIPDLDLPAEVTITAGGLKQSIEAAEMIGDHVQLAVEKTLDGDEAFFVRAEGDTDDVEYRIDRDDDDLVDLDFGAGSSLFSIDYMKSFKKAIPKDAEVRMEVGDEFPVKMHYETVEVDEETHADVTMMLAPRIQGD